MGGGRVGQAGPTRAAHHIASASPGHRGSETFPPALKVNPLTAFIMMIPGFCVFPSLLSPIKTQSILGCFVIRPVSLCMAHVKENTWLFASFMFY